MNSLFRDRTHAAQALAPKLREFAQRPDVTIITPSRGGVRVAYHVARKLRVPFDLMLVRKLRVFEDDVVAFGAVTSGVEFHDQPVIAALGLTPAVIGDAVRRARITLEMQERAGHRRVSSPALEGRTVILVDDGIATGLTMHAALRAVKAQKARAIIIAAPVASIEAVDALRPEVDRIITVVTAERLCEVAGCFGHFPPPTDEEIKSLLARNTVGAADDKTAAA
jgi:putative phosphoribosyl transferase